MHGKGAPSEAADMRAGVCVPVQVLLFPAMKPADEKPAEETAGPSQGAE